MKTKYNKGNKKKLRKGNSNSGKKRELNEYCNKGNWATKVKNINKGKHYKSL